MIPCRVRSGVITREKLFTYHRFLNCLDGTAPANSTKPDQTALWEQSDLDLHCLLKCL